MSLGDTVLDFRSDTVTRPTPGMRRAMAAAEVGDDVFGEDPTVNRLEERVCELFGREAALLVPSGTMANLIGMALHCRRGDEVILERRTHSFAHEAGGGAALFGLMFNVQDSPGGMLTVEQAEAAVRPDDIHDPPSRLVILENTVNLAGGLVVPLEQLRAFRRMTRSRNLRLHLDGARIWNAAAASGVPLPEYAAAVDTLCCCLSKGLGCPAGSLLIGDRPEVERARRLRKMLGGGMRQAGILAAGGLYALEHHLERLEEDHTQTRELAAGLRQALDQHFRVKDAQSNILLIETDSPKTTAATLESWSRMGIRALALSATAIRLVTHLDIPPGGAREALRRIGEAP